MGDYLTAPLARVEGIIEGTYPVVAVSGRSVTAARFVATRLHGDIEDPDFPMKHFAPAGGGVAYVALPVTTGYASPDTATTGYVPSMIPSTRASGAVR